MPLTFENRSKWRLSNSSVFVTIFSCPICTTSHTIHFNDKTNPGKYNIVDFFIIINIETVSNVQKNSEINLKTVLNERVWWYWKEKTIVITGNTYHSENGDHTVPAVQPLIETDIKFCCEKFNLSFPYSPIPRCDGNSLSISQHINYQLSCYDASLVIITSSVGLSFNVESMGKRTYCEYVLLELTREIPEVVQTSKNKCIELL